MAAAWLYSRSSSSATALVRADDKGPAPDKVWVYVGTYTQGTKSKGIYRFEFDAATGCDEEINALEASAHALVFESRLRAANDEKPSDAIANQLRELEARRVGIIMSHVEHLKSSLDAGRFRIVEDFIRSRQSDGVFFPVARSPGKEPK